VPFVCGLLLDYRYLPCCYLGKIDQSGAEAQALDSGGVALQSARSSGTGGEGQQDGGSGEADLTLVARGNVRLETMSWIQVIRSKYGFEDTPDASTKGTAPPAHVGRTASASSRAADLARAALDDPDK
jgi:hypothetical protein